MTPISSNIWRGPRPKDLKDLKGFGKQPINSTYQLKRGKQMDDEKKTLYDYWDITGGE